METIIYSAVGIISLIGISFFFSRLGDIRSNNAAKRLAEFRKKLALKTKWLSDDRSREQSSVFRRTVQNERFNIFPPNGDTPVL